MPVAVKSIKDTPSVDMLDAPPVIAFQAAKELTSPKVPFTYNLYSVPMTVDIVWPIKPIESVNVTLIPPLIKSLSIVELLTPQSPLNPTLSEPVPFTTKLVDS